MPSKIFIKSDEFETTDKETGEIVKVHTEKLYKVTVANSEEFFQVYVAMLAPFYKLKYVDDMKLLVKFCEIATFNTGVVMMPAAVRKKICDECDIHSSNLSRSIKRLKELKLIEGEGGAYVINPSIFWKGTQKEREKLLQSKSLKLTFEFSTES
jgi:hypothetical protein